MPGSDGCNRRYPGAGGRERLDGDDRRSCRPRWGVHTHLSNSNQKPLFYRESAVEVMEVSPAPPSSSGGDVDERSRDDGMLSAGLRRAWRGGAARSSRSPDPRAICRHTSRKESDRYLRTRAETHRLGRRVLQPGFGLGCHRQVVHGVSGAHAAAAGRPDTYWRRGPRSTSTTRQTRAPPGRPGRLKIVSLEARTAFALTMRRRIDNLNTEITYSDRGEL